MTKNRDLWSSLLPGLIYVLIIWVIWLLENAFSLRLYFLALYPRSWEGLWGILGAPFLHGDLSHIVSNTLPLFILCFLLFSVYRKSAWILIIWLFISTGFWTWTFARSGYHIGASGIIYGLASFLFFAGIVRRDPSSWAISLVVIFFYSSLLVGLLPSDAPISWESHLSGALAGMGFALIYRQWPASDRPKPPRASKAKEEELVQLISLKRLTNPHPTENKENRK